MPIGTRAFAVAYMRARVAAADALHREVRLLECVQSAYIIARYSLSRRMDYHVGALGADIMGGARARWWEDAGSGTPGALHDAQMRRMKPRVSERGSSSYSDLSSSKKVRASSYNRRPRWQLLVVPLLRSSGP